jgi:hypothetical protein
MRPERVQEIGNREGQGREMRKRRYDTQERELRLLRHKITPHRHIGQIRLPEWH